MSGKGRQAAMKCHSERSEEYRGGEVKPHPTLRSFTAFRMTEGLNPPSSPFDKGDNPPGNNEV